MDETSSNVAVPTTGRSRWWPLGGDGGILCSAGGMFAVGAMWDEQVCYLDGCSF